jgi:hypothetical protein
MTPSLRSFLQFRSLSQVSRLSPDKTRLSYKSAQISMSGKATNSLLKNPVFLVLGSEIQIIAGL